MDDLAERVCIRVLTDSTALFSKRAFKAGECIAAEDALVATRSLALLPLVARSLAVNLDPTPFEHELEGVSWQHQLVLEPDVVRMLVQLGVQYRVPYEPHMKNRLLLLHHYATVATTPLSGLPVGRALYKYGAHVQHRCRPNVMRVFDGDFRCMLFALEPIGPGEQLTCSWTIPETSILPVESRYCLVRSTLRRNCVCCSCVHDTMGIRAKDGMSETFPLNQPGADAEWSVSISQLEDPVRGALPKRRSLDDVSADVEESKGADWPTLEMMYVCQLQETEHFVPDYFLREGDLVRSKIAHLPELLTDPAEAHQTLVVVVEHLSHTLRLIREMRRCRERVSPVLLAELVTFMRFIASGHWCSARISRKDLYQLIRLMAGHIILALAGPMEVRMVHEHVYGRLQLWLRCWAMLKALQPALPALHTLVEVYEQAPLEIFDSQGLTPGMMFTPLIRQVLIGELQLNRSTGVFPLWVDAVRDLGVPLQQPCFLKETCPRKRKGKGKGKPSR